MRTAEERARNTEYARQARARQLAAANMKALRCTAYLGRGKPCRTPLQSRFVDGETVPFCPTCDLKARGLCIDCREAPVYGTPRRALRCAACLRLARHAQYDTYRRRNASKLKAREACRLADPAKRAAKLEYKRLYRQSKPKTVAAYKKADYEKHRERYLEYHRQYREARRAKLAETERLRLRGELPPRTCLTCPTVLTGRAKLCARCKQQQRTHARAAIAARMVAA